MFFSIILPTFNRANLIQKAILSVVNQSCSDWELIIIDDGSTDNTEEVVLSFQDSRIKYFYQKNAERSVARNNGVRRARGEWICFLDSDDYFLSNHLESLQKFILEKNLTPSFLITGGYEEHKGRLIKKTLFDSSFGAHPAQFILKQTSITPISVCIHSSCFKSHEFPEIYKKSYWEDTHLWIRMSLSFPFYQLKSYTNVLAEHPSRSVNSKTTMLRVMDHINMIHHLSENYSELLNPIIKKSDISDYVDRKYRMFLYNTRQNKQFRVALQIWIKGFIHNPSIYFLAEFPKILLNQLNIGIHER